MVSNCKYDIIEKESLLAPKLDFEFVGGLLEQIMKGWGELSVGKQEHSRY